MVKYIKDAIKGIYDFTKSDKFKQVLIADLIVIAIVTSTVLGISAYIKHKRTLRHEAMEEKVDRIMIRRGVDYLIQVVDAQLAAKQEVSTKDKL